jgi:hypothetical protein
MKKIEKILKMFVKKLTSNIHLKLIVYHLWLKLKLTTGLNTSTTGDRIQVALQINTLALAQSN